MLESLLSDDYIAITASGTLQNKQQTLDNLRLGRTKFTSLDISDRKVRFYGTTALVTSLASVEGTANDDQLTGNYRYTRVYVRNAQGTWKVVSFEASKIRGNPATTPTTNRRFPIPVRCGSGYCHCSK